MRRCVAIGLLGLGLALISSAGHAQTSDEDVFKQGAALYYRGEYAEALVEFKRAFQLSPDPVILLNIGLCYWRLDDLDHAIQASQSVLEVEGLDDELAAQASSRQRAWRVLRRARVVSHTPVASVSTVVETSKRATEPEVIVEREPVPRSHPFRWVGAGIGLAGAAALVSWAVVEAGLNRDFAALDSAQEEGNALEFQSIRSQIERRQRLARPLLIGGAAAFATGAVLVLVDLFAADSDAVATIGFGPDGTPVLSAQLRF